MRYHSARTRGGRWNLSDTQLNRDQADTSFGLRLHQDFPPRSSVSDAKRGLEDSSPNEGDSSGSEWEEAPADDQGALLLQLQQAMLPSTLLSPSQRQAAAVTAGESLPWLPAIGECEVAVGAGTATSRLSSQQLQRLNGELAEAQARQLALTSALLQAQVSQGFVTVSWCVQTHKRCLNLWSGTTNRTMLACGFVCKRRCPLRASRTTSDGCPSSAKHCRPHCSCRWAAITCRSVGRHAHVLALPDACMRCNVHDVSLDQRPATHRTNSLWAHAPIAALLFRSCGSLCPIEPHP
jgi:hypothetical protein